VCSTAGCKYFDVDSKTFAAGLQMDEVLVLTRTTNTVRAVEIQSGVEKYVHMYVCMVHVENYSCIWIFRHLIIIIIIIN